MSVLGTEATGALNDLAPAAWGMGMIVIKETPSRGVIHEPREGHKAGGQVGICWAEKKRKAVQREETPPAKAKMWKNQTREVTI